MDETKHITGLIMTSMSTIILLQMIGFYYENNNVFNYTCNITNFYQPAQYISVITFLFSLYLWLLLTLVYFFHP